MRGVLQPSLLQPAEDNGGAELTAVRLSAPASYGEACGLCLRSRMGGTTTGRRQHEQNAGMVNGSLAVE